MICWYYFLLIPYLWNLHVCIFLLLFFFHKILFLIFFIKLNMFCVWVAFGGSLTFLIFDDFILTLCSFNIICDSSFVTFGSSLTFFLTFDYSILTLCSFNIICDSSFVTFGSSLIFFSYFDSSILTLCSFNITCDNSFVTFGGSFIFFLTFDSFILILCSTLTVLLSHSVVP